MAITVRFATHEDLPVLIELMHEFHAEAGYNLDPERARSSFVSLLQNPGYGRVWLLFNEATPAGHVVLTLRFSMEFGGLEGYIDDLYVRPQYRRRGHARAALSVLRDFAGQNGLKALHVLVGRDNIAASALYESFGLKPPPDGRQMLSVVFGRHH